MGKEKRHNFVVSQENWSSIAKAIKTKGGTRKKYKRPLRKIFQTLSVKKISLCPMGGKWSGYRSAP